MSKTIWALSKTLRNVAQHACYSTQSAGEKQLKDQLRVVLREIPQPVAVITSLMPPKHQNRTNNRLHGATLSSFTSIAMDPYPLVAFSLRVPSRMASSLESTSVEHPSDLVVNFLTVVQGSAAIAFSRPDLYPQPFDSIPYALTEDGLPVLEGVSSAISCKLVSKAIPLHDLEFLRNGTKGEKEKLAGPVLGEGGVASELFIARVIRVEKLPALEEAKRMPPLVYHQRSYTTVTCLSTRPSKPKS